VHGLLSTGHTQVVDADLFAYFDTVPHSELVKSIARRVVDRQMPHLLKMWLETGVEETDDRGRKKRTTRNCDEKRGIPRGSRRSPLLSNLYMRRFVLGWKRLGYERRLGAHIVSYADDLVICCKGSAEEALPAMPDIMTRLKLTVNERETHVCCIPEQHFDFLRYTLGRCYSTQTGRAYLGTRPSKKSVSRLLTKIHEQTARNRTWLPADGVVLGLNGTLHGWANYFQLGPVDKAYRFEDANPKISVVISDILGEGGRAVLQALIDGHSDPEVLTSRITTRVNGTRAELLEALRGRVSAHHRFTLEAHLCHIDALDKAIASIETEVCTGLKPVRHAAKLPSTMPGLSEVSANVVVARTGIDMSRFAIPAHLLSWACM
jgi:hypothetical protein